MHHLAVSAAIKAAKQALLHPDKTFLTVLKVFIAIGGVFIAISTISVEMIGAFLNTGNVNDDYIATEIDVYKDICKGYQMYYDELQELMDKREEEIIEEYTRTETETDENGNVHTRTYCEAQVIKQINPISVLYYMSYINHIESENLKKSETYTVDIEKAYAFCCSISTYQEKEVDVDAGEIKKQFYLYNVVLPLDKVAMMYFPEDVQLRDMFLQSYELYLQFIADYSGIEDGVVGDVEYPDTGLFIPHYFQTDYKHVPYGSGNIASKGCAPTSLAMVLSYLKGTTISPTDVVKWTGNKYYVSGAGSSWGIFPAVADEWGVSCESMGKSIEKVISALEEGKPVIASMGKGTFTKGGHFVVIRGVTAEGKFLVNDPNKSNYTKYGTDEFDSRIFADEAKNFWCFE